MKIFTYDNGKVTDLSNVDDLDIHLVDNVCSEQLIQAELNENELLKIGNYFCGSITMSENSTLIIKGDYVILNISYSKGTIINHGEGNIVVLYGDDYGDEKAIPYSLKKNTKYNVFECELTEVSEPLYEIKLVNNLLTKEQLNKLALTNISFTSTEVKQ